MVASPDSPRSVLSVVKGRFGIETRCCGKPLCSRRGWVLRGEWSAGGSRISTSKIGSRVFIKFVPGRGVTEQYLECPRIDED